MTKSYEEIEAHNQILEAQVQSLQKTVDLLRELICKSFSSSDAKEILYGGYRGAKIEHTIHDEEALSTSGPVTVEMLNEQQKRVDRWAAELRDARLLEKKYCEDTEKLVADADLVAQGMTVADDPIPGRSFKQRYFACSPFNPNPEKIGTRPMTPEEIKAKREREEKEQRESGPEYMTVCFGHGDYRRVKVIE